MVPSAEKDPKPTEAPIAAVESRGPPEIAVMRVIEMKNAGIAARAEPIGPTDERQMAAAAADMRDDATESPAPTEFFIPMNRRLPQPGMNAQAKVASTTFFATYLFAILYNSQIVKFFDGNLFEYVNRSLYLIAGATFLSGIMLGEIIAAAISFVIFAYLAIMTVVGNYNTIDGLSNNLFLVYASLASAPVAAYLFRTGRGNTIATAIKCASAIYLILYVYFSLTLSANSSPAKSGGGFIMAADGRDARIVIDATVAATGYFLSLAGLRTWRITISNIGLIILAITSIFLSHSRQFSLLIVVISGIYIVFGNKKLLINFLSVVFMLATVAMLGSAIINWNIYSYFASDSSGYARMQELETIKHYFWQNAIFGKGFFNPLAVDRSGVVNYSSIVFWNDMGIYGVLYATGILGLIVFLALSLLAIKSRPTFARAGLNPTLVDGLSLASIGIATLGVSSPNLWTSGLELIALIVAALAVGRRTVRAKPRGIRSAARHSR